jgi:hypothetical protein
LKANHLATLRRGIILYEAKTKETAQPEKPGFKQNKPSKPTRRAAQGCQMVDFHTKNPNESVFMQGLGMEMFYGSLETSTVIW